MAWVRFWRRPGGGNLVKTYQPGSILSLAPTKGLLNEPGQNSCFLNSAVQVLWQLDIFRRSLRGLTGHVCFGDACIFCALKSIFAQFQHSREKALPSDIMRNALAESFKDEHRFQLGHMDDAAECFENILARIHFHIVPNSEGDMCTSKSCITHQKFAMTLYEQCVCRSCGASSDPLPFTEFVRYISTTALCNEVDRMLERHERLKPELFAELLQAANTADDYRKCPSNCGQKIKIRRVLMNCPEIVTIGLVWDYEHSDLTENVLKNLATQLYLPGLFYSVTDEKAKNSELCLVGMICYASRHYCAFAYHNRSSKWVFFDDATVKEWDIGQWCKLCMLAVSRNPYSFLENEFCDRDHACCEFKKAFRDNMIFTGQTEKVGPRWKDVVTKCIRCHFQPLLLFYANPDGTSVSTEDALREVIQWSPYKTVPGSREETGTERVPLYSKKQDPAKQFEYRDSGNMNSGHRIESEGGAFNRGPVQASGGRGQVKVGHNDQRDRVKDISKECAQKALLKSTSSSQRKIVDRVQRKDVAKRKDDLNQFKSGSPPLTYEFKSGNPVGNGFRPPTDHHFFYSQGRGPYKHERATPSTKSVQLLASSKPQALSVERQASKVKSDILTDSETESSINSKDKGSSKSHRAWKPMRETLNVDSVFHETEKKQPHSPRHKANSSSKPQYSKEQSFNWQREIPKQKGLTTIYEDESKLDSGSRSSLESEGKGQGEKERGKGLPDLKAHLQDNWQMQRTESGYESSDHISNGSTNLDSPVIEGTSPGDSKSVKEAFFYSDPQPTNKLHNGVAENGFYSATLYTKSHDDVSKAEKTALEVNYRPHDKWSSESDLQMRTLPPQRQEMADSNKKFFPLLNAPEPLKNSTTKEMQTNKSNFNHSERLLQDEHVVLLHSNASCTTSFNSVNTVVNNVLPNEKECLPSFQYPVKSTATKAPLQSSLQTLPSQDFPGTNKMPLGESYVPETLGNTGIYCGPVTNNVAPALPPKKYARSTVPGRETNSESGNKGQVVEMLERLKPSRHGKGPSGDSSATGYEKQVSVKDTGQKNGIQEHDFHVRKTNLPVTLPNDCWAVPDSPLSQSSQDGQSSDSMSENDTVSLTTYFSVDSCMTDTYRMKYHQRPRLYFSENSDFQKDGESLRLGEKELDPTLHRTVNSRPTPGPRSKVSPGAVHCNR